MNKRPFILSRSTTMGQGKIGFHWLGDNISNYFYMRNAIQGIFQFQIFGIPFVGDDVCGFNENAWDELCARWTVLAAFTPFSRNHNRKGTRRQDPGSWGINSLTLASSKKAINLRYSLLRYFYTELYKVSLGEKSSYFKPLFFEYFKDLNTFKVQLEDSILIGDSILFCPIYSDTEEDKEIYFPNDDWNLFPTGEIFLNKNISSNDGTFAKISGKFNYINSFIRGGKIIPFQDTNKKFIKNSYYLQKEPIELIINPDSINHLASGEIIFDDDSIDNIETKNYYYISIDFNYDTLSVNIKNKMINNDILKNIYLSKITFFRIDYLLEEEKCFLAKIIMNNRLIINIPIINKSENIIEIDIRKYKIKIDEILQIRLFTNNS